jgi:hypothetical protein
MRRNSGGDFRRGSNDGYPPYASQQQQPARQQPQQDYPSKSLSQYYDRREERAVSGGSDANDSYPLSKMRGNENSDYSRQSMNRDQDRSNFQEVRARSNERSVQRVAQNYFQPGTGSQQEGKSTRPW